MKDVKVFLNSLLKKDDTIVLAVSGGPDSMCLLSVLNNLKSRYNLNIICAHVNHNLRKESNDEAKFVENYCVINNIIFEYMIIENYKNNKFSEQEAREKRYNFFEELVKKYNANYLMTAHHGDDLIETILMRIVRGSNLKGYIGIPKIKNYNNYKLVRPLLYLSKEDIYEYLKKEKIKYVIDKSNESEKYTRNRYRKHVLPFLKNEEKKVHNKFLEYSEELEKSNNFINKYLENIFNNIVHNNIININELLKEDEYIQEKILEKVIENIQKYNVFNINKEQLNNIYKLINNHGNVTIDLADNYIARKSYNKLYIEKKQIFEKYKYIFKDKIEILDKFIIEKINKSDSKSNNIIRINSNEIELPLIIRNKLDGDKMKVKNLGGSKKIKDIFIDSKIDNKKRDEYPIVTDSKNTIIWIPGIKKSIFDKEISEKYDIILKYTEGKDE